MIVELDGIVEESQRSKDWVASRQQTITDTDGLEKERKGMVRTGRRT